MEDETRGAAAALRRGAADRARAAVPDARPRHRGRRSRSDVGAADRADPGGRAGRGRGGRRGASASSRTRSGRCRGSRRWPSSSTRGFLLCAVLDDVSRRRVIKFAYDEPLARPGRSVALLRHAGLHGGGELPRRGRRAGRDARAHDRDGRRPHGRGARARARATPTGPASTTSPTPDAASSPGLSVQLRHRARPLPRPGGARGVGDRARAGAAVAVRRPARAGGVRRPGDRGAAVVVGDLLGPRAARGRAPAGAARCSRPTGCAWPRRRVAAVVAGGDAGLPRLARRRSTWTWGVGALVAVLAAGILSVEAARAPAAAKDH